MSAAAPDFVADAAPDFVADAAPDFVADAAPDFVADETDGLSVPTENLSVTSVMPQAIRCPYVLVLIVLRLTYCSILN
jgi:hypothetical protein